MKIVVELKAAEVSVKGKPILKPIDFVGQAGSTTAIRGTNGSGKTSLLRMLSGLIKPSTGNRIGPESCAYVPAAIDPPPLPAGSAPSHERTVPTSN